MRPIAFGIDFGTTNSLASVVVRDRALSLTDVATGRPHPSVIWYRGSEVVVGREAKQYLDITAEGAPPGFVRSPKMRLRREGPIFADGRAIDPTDAVSKVLQHLKRDAAAPRDRATGYHVSRAVVTIPVDFGGRERRALRQAALKAGIGVIQFVHEPVAALYGYLRAQPDYRRALTRLEGRSVLVFDWGGGTLDLTLCRIQGGSIMQIGSLGDNEVGGDEFDGRLRNLLREKHAGAHALVLLRFRYRFQEEIEEFAEEIVLAAFERGQNGPQWLEPLPTAARDLAPAAEPRANISREERSQNIQRALDILNADPDWFRPVLDWRGAELGAAHKRATRRVGLFSARR